MVQTTSLQDSSYKCLPKSFLFISQHFCDCHQLNKSRKTAIFHHPNGWGPHNYLLATWSFIKKLETRVPSYQPSVYDTFLKCSAASGSVFLSGWRCRESWRKARRISALLADCDTVCVFVCVCVCVCGGGGGVG